MVTLTGTDFQGATAVKFGDIPAASFSVKSETELVAVAPASAQVSTAGVSFTTPAGTATSATGFVYLGCVVPNLKGLKLKAAKGLLRAASCSLGRPHKKRTGRKVGRILSQEPAAGVVSPPGSKVSPVLGIRLPRHRR